MILGQNYFFDGLPLFLGLGVSLFSGSALRFPSAGAISWLDGELSSDAGLVGFSAGVGSTLSTATVPVTLPAAASKGAFGIDFVISGD